MKKIKIENLTFKDVGRFVMLGEMVGKIRRWDNNFIYVDFEYKKEYDKYFIQRIEPQRLQFLDDAFDG